jgi:copper transporter 1
MSMSVMATSISGSPTKTMAGMSMASSMPTSSLSDPMMVMDSMAMTFFTSTGTPLYSLSWTPNSTGRYIGTCMFLIAFATSFRALLAFRVNFFEVLTAVKHRSEGSLYPYASDAKSTTHTIRPWRVNEAVMVATMDVVLAGIGYLL